MFGSHVLKGLYRLARGNPAGIASFGNSQDALFAAIAPLIAFPLVATIILCLDGLAQAAIISFLARLCAVLAVSVLTHAVAAATGRESFWIRTVTALYWSFWLIIPLLLIAGLIGGVLVAAGMPDMRALDLSIALLAAYLLWYAWFTVRSGLQLPSLPAAGLVLLTLAAIGLLSIAPDLIDRLLARP